MAFYDKFPYTNFQELNLDWLINEVGNVHNEALDAKASAEAAANSQNAALASQQAAAASQNAAAGSETNAETYALRIQAAAAEIQNISDRVDTILVEGTPTEGNAELIDIRTAAAGFSPATYSTAGDAVRGQVSEVNNNVEALKDICYYSNGRIDKKLYGYTGVNTFDKTGEYSDIRPDRYRDYRDGVESIVANYSEIVQTVYPGEKYSFSKGNSHVCFFTGYDLKTFISGVLTDVTPAGITTQVTVPANAHAMTFSTLTSNLNTLNIQKGSYAALAYIPFKIGVGDSELHNSIAVTGHPGINLFDKSGQRTMIQTGVYRDYSLGTYGTNAGFECATFFNVQGAQVYTANGNNIHVCFFSDDYATEYIGGFLINAANGHTFTTPAACRSMTVSLQIPFADQFQLEYGSTMTEYQNYIFGIDSSMIIDSSNQLHVGPQREYTTIQSAVDAASSGDVIYIDPGVYLEAVDCVGKNIHMIGCGADITQIQYPGDDYYYPPLEASGGLFENLSFVCTSSTPAQGAISQSYAVHIDYDAEENNALTFLHCKFKTVNRHTVGIGLRDHFTVRFEDCTFTSQAAPVYCHEQQANNKIEQKIELVDCTIRTNGTDGCILLQETPAFTGNRMHILMQRVIAKTNGDAIMKAQTYPDHTDPTTGGHYLHLQSWYLDEMSSLNTAANMNALNPQ